MSTITTTSRRTTATLRTALITSAAVSAGVRPTSARITATLAVLVSAPSRGTSATITAMLTAEKAFWNPAGLPDGVTLSNSNLTVTCPYGLAGPVNVTSASSVAAGLAYFEVTLANPGWDAIDPTTAIMLSTSAGTHGVRIMPGYFDDIYDSLYVEGPPIAFGGSTEATPVVVSVALDATQRLIWFSGPAMRAIGYSWNNSSTANPVTGTGGLSFAGLGPGPYLICWSQPLAVAEGYGSSATLNTTGAFDQAIPTGFMPWDQAASMVTISISTTISAPSRVSTAAITTDILPALAH